jgi:hypothetical protein
MSIGVQSFVELYATLIGWQQYDAMWNLLTQTGAAYLPFIGVILKNIVQPYESQETKSAAGTSLRRMEVDLIIRLLLIFFAVSPALSLNASVVSYTPVCQPDGQQNTYHAGDTGTTYDQAFSVPTGDIRVPLFWYAVLSFSGGSTAAANTTVACVPDYRKMITQVDMTQIQSAPLKQELHQFEEDCFLPARAQYLKDANTESVNNPVIQNDASKYGNDDTEWLGSHGFQDTYYQNLKASQPVAGFPYDPNEDVNAGAYPDGMSPPAYATPSCTDWWNDSENGLKARLYGALPTSFMTEFKDVFSSHDKLQDDVVKRIVTNGGADYSATDNIEDTHDIANRLLENVGLIYSQLESYPTIYAISQAAPIVQALLLLMVFSFLPFALVFTGYKPMAFTTGAMVIFSLFFWSYIWHFVGWVDSTLMLAFFNDSWFTMRSPNETLLTIIIGFLQIVAPLFWFGLMSVMGVTAGGLFSALSASLGDLLSNPARQAGRGGAEAIQMAAGAAMRKIDAVAEGKEGLGE